MSAPRPVDPLYLDRIRSELQLSLPRSFIETSAVFDGSAPAFEVHNLCAANPDVIGETKRLRDAIDLPAKFLVLAEPPESLIVLDCADGTVTWCDAFDVARLGRAPLIGSPDVWQSYAEFVDFVLHQQDEA